MPIPEQPHTLSPESPVAFFTVEYRDGSEIEFSVKLDWDHLYRLAHRAAFDNASHKVVAGPITIRRTVVHRRPR
jgi:hypothetical protein